VVEELWGEDVVLARELWWRGKAQSELSTRSRKEERRRELWWRAMTSHRRNAFTRSRPRLRLGLGLGGSAHEGELN
jgi:hypothetical protein